MKGKIIFMAIYWGCSLFGVISSIFGLGAFAIGTEHAVVHLLNILMGIVLMGIGERFKDFAE